MKRSIIGLLVVLMAALVAGLRYGYLLDTTAAASPAGQAQGEVVNGVEQDDSGREVLYWYDPMVPNQRFDKSGKSPFMDMLLVPKYADEVGEAGVVIPSGVTQNLGIRLGKVEQGVFTDTLSAVARVAVDEHRVHAVQTRAAGFIERLSVRAVGDRVRPGQKVAEVYAPELLAAQSELIALRRLEPMAGLDDLRAGARQRLRLLGMNEAEIRAVEDSGNARAAVGIYAPVGGFVQELGVRDGGQVVPGQTLLQIADLAHMWLIAEVAERDLSRLGIGQKVTARFAALPQADLTGKVDYVYPDLDHETRTGRVRIALPNPGNKLQLGMYAQVGLAGASHEALTVPSEAVIATGTRTVVIGHNNGAFLPIAVETGREANGRTEILAGLNAGEEVVLSGQFLIDSEATLSGVLARLSHQATQPTPAKNASTTTATTRAVVTAIDGASVELSHEPIAELGWPAMTMKFRLRDPQAATDLTVGANVAAEIAVQPEGGDYIIERIQPEET